MLMKRIDIRQNKILFIETIVVVIAILFALLLIFYSVLFSIFNDFRRQNYDEQYLLEIYQEDENDFNKLVTLIKDKEIETISHGLMIDKSENYVYINTLYYQSSSALEKSNLDDVAYYSYNIFDKYDFDVIENNNETVSFTYFSASVELVYDNLGNQLNSNREYKEINDNWYIHSFS